MNAAPKKGALFWRLGVCGLLLLWVFHCIFVNEGRLIWRAQGLPWDTLGRLEQWRIGWSLGPIELWQKLNIVTADAFFVSLLLMGLTLLFGIIRWRMVLNVVGLSLPFSRASSISLVAQFFNSFLLGSTGGDLLKAYYTARETHHQKTEAVVTVFVDRLIGLFSMLWFACAMMLPNRDLILSHRSLKVMAALVAGMTLACTGVVVVAFWGGVSRTFPRARDWLRKMPKGEYLERSLDACRRFGREPRFLVKSLLVSTLLNMACVWQVMVLAQGLKLVIPAQVLYLMVPTIICISSLPVTPSGLGVRENLYVLVLSVAPMHIDATKALSLSLLAYAGFLIWSLIGGAVYLGLRQREHLDEVAREESNGHGAP